MEKIRQLPRQEKRVETGPVQFGNDWPGVFIRGDNAAYYAFTLRRFLDEAKSKHSDSFANELHYSPLENLYSDLKGCVIGGVKDLLK